MQALVRQAFSQAQAADDFVRAKVCVGGEQVRTKIFTLIHDYV